MGYSPGFLVKICRFRLIANVPENFTNNLVRSQKSICKHLGDVFREFWPISSTCQNQPCSKPWAIVQAFWSKSADFVSLKILPKTSRTSLYALTNSFASMLMTFLRECWPIYSTYQNPPFSKPWAIAHAFSSKSDDFVSLKIFPKTLRTSLYALRNPFASMLATFLGSLGGFPALTKIRPLQNHGLQPRLFVQNRPISSHCNFSRKLHEQVFTHLRSHLQACWRPFKGVLADFQHLPKSPMFKTMSYCPGFFVKIGRFRLIANSPENFTNKSLRTQTSICKHICHVFREFGPISSTCQNRPCSIPWAIAQAFWSKSADFVSLQILPKTSRTSLYALTNPFASMLATF